MHHIADDRHRPGPERGSKRGRPLDDARFTELYAQWRGPLVSLCRRQLGPTRDAEAIAQEAFIRAWRSRGRFADDRPFWPWLATIARRLCTNEMARGRRRAELAEHAASREITPAGADDLELEGVLSAPAVMRALRALPARQQRMLVLRDMEGWSYAEIAGLEGVSAEAVRGSLRRARSAFRRLYESIGGSALAGWMTRRRDGLHLLSRLPPVAGRALADGIALGLAAWLLVPGDAAAPLRNVPAAQPAVAPPTRAEAPVERSDAPVGHPRPAAASVRPALDAPDSTRVEAGGDGDLGAMYLRQITPSPSYEQDRTVFASGVLTSCVTFGMFCQALYRSDDGGVRWKRLAAEGLEHPLIALPPTFPLDNRIFASSPSTLKVSEDGGQTFRVLAAVGGAPRISPLFSGGDPRIFVITALDAARLVSEYDDRLGTAKPWSLVLPDATFPVDLAFGPTYGVDGHMVVAAFRADLTGKVFSCTNLVCQDVLTLAGPGLPSIVSGPRADTMFASGGGRLYRSDNGGRSFRELWKPGPHEAPVVAPDGTVFVNVTDGFHRAELFASTDGGTTWTSRAATDSPAQFANLVVLPDGRMLAGLTLGGRFGMRCSVDGGRTWGESCGSPPQGAP